MTKIPERPRQSRWSAFSTSAALTVVTMLAAAPSAQAFSSLLSNFNNTYPGSMTGANAGCAVCHRSTGGTGGGFNEYGFRYWQNSRSFSAIEGMLSANVNGGTTMLDEINAGTQPGWTTGANNNVYSLGGSFQSSNASAPGGIGGDLDPVATPPANLPPTANAGGPYTGTTGKAVSFDGSGSSDPDGTIASYNWTFGDGGSSTDANPTHTYAGAGTYNVELTVTDNDGDSSTPSKTMATIDDVPPPPQCQVDADCNNGVFCDGAETCEAGTCVAGSDPCTGPGETCDETADVCVPPPPQCQVDADCNNGVFCDGAETCEAGTCVAATDPCAGTGEICDESTQSCTQPAGADVYLKRMKAPRELKARVGRTVQRRVTVKGDGTGMEQDATVVLSAQASPEIGVVIDPDSVTKSVEPGGRKTAFRFTVRISCNGESSGTVDWTATIGAPINDDASNDTLSASTRVKCERKRNRRHDDDDDMEDGDDDHGDDEHGNDEDKEDGEDD